MIRNHLSFLLLLVLPTAVFGWELGTHAYVTKAAVDASVLSPAHPKSIVPVLSFNRLDPRQALRGHVRDDRFA